MLDYTRFARTLLVLPVVVAGACTLFTPISGLSGGTVGDGESDADIAVIRTEDGGPRDATVELDSALDGGCPCSFFGDTVPGDLAPSDPNPIEVGIRFTSDIPAKVVAIRFYKLAENNGTHTGSLWSGSGRVATETFSNETAYGWQTVVLSTPVRIDANTPYVASYHTSGGGYAATNLFFANGFAVPPLRAASDNGLYTYGDSALPMEQFNFSNYWVDVVIESAQ